MTELQNPILVSKKVGETPLEALERVRIEKEISSQVPMTYAGRLDPMAEGLLLVLVGEECKRKEEYLGLPKTYEVEILFGFETDTYDILGKLMSGEERAISSIEIGEIKMELEKFKGKFIQEYPKYSSKVFSKVAISAIATNTTFFDEMPIKEVEIFDIEFIEEREIEFDTLLLQIKEKIEMVQGDFRQREIIPLWQSTLFDSNKNYKITKLKISCSSGTYMRSLAHNLGQKLGIPALAFSIKRTRVGDYVL